MSYCVVQHTTLIHNNKEKDSEINVEIHESNTHKLHGLEMSLHSQNFRSFISYDITTLSELQEQHFTHTISILSLRLFSY